MNEKFYKAFHEKHAIQRYLARRFFFELFQRIGFHVTGDHFYEIVPDTRLVAAKYTDAPRPLAGIDWRLPACEQHVLRLIDSYGSEYSRASQKYGFREKNFYFRGLDALLLYLIVRDLKPRKTVEIGQGFSTRIILSALERNAEETSQAAEFISIDPYKRFTKEKMPEHVNFRIINQPLQSVELDSLLKNCGLLFVDSSHVYKFGSDVEYEFTQIYPRLHPNTIVHVHDIFSPYNYPLDCIVKEKQFWNEQYLLESFLMFNRAFEVYLPVNLLARQSDAVAEAVRRLPLEEKFKFAGSSFYLNRK